MKKYIIILLFPLSILGQSFDISFASRMFYPSVINPAAAGLINQGNSGIFVEHQSKYVGLDGAPSISNAGYNGRIFSDQLGFGLNFNNDNFGAISKSRFATDLSYKIQASALYSISFGVKGGISKNDFDVTKLSMLNPSDQSLIEQFNQNIIYDFTIGVFIYSQNFFIEAAIPLLSNENFFSVADSNSIQLQPDYIYTSAGFKLLADREFQVIPSVTFFNGKNLDFSKEASIMAMTPQYFFGTSYRFDSHFSIIAGINLFDSFTLGYTYESIVSSLRPTIKNSHGIFLKLNFGSLDPVNVNLVSPRF